MSVAITIILSFFLGIAANYSTRRIIKNRYTSEYSSWYINKNYSPFIWGICFCGIMLWQWLCTNDYLWLLRISSIVFASFCISATDILIRRVPNSLLCLLLVNSIVFKIVDSKKENYIFLLLAVTVSIIIFTLPSLLGLSIGSGDIKFAVVTAIELSLMGFLQAMIIVGISFLITAGYLLITKKGTLKTQIPMGPYIALGMIITTVLPLY